jgi:hypothetical protein
MFQLGAKGIEGEEEELLNKCVKAISLNEPARMSK